MIAMLWVADSSAGPVMICLRSDPLTAGGCCAAAWCDRDLAVDNNRDRDCQENCTRTLKSGTRYAMTVTRAPSHDAGSEATPHTSRLSWLTRLPSLRRRTLGRGAK